MRRGDPLVSEATDIAKAEIVDEQNDHFWLALSLPKGGLLGLAESGAQARGDGASSGCFYEVSSIGAMHCRLVVG